MTPRVGDRVVWLDFADFPAGVVERIYGTREGQAVVRMDYGSPRLVALLDLVLEGEWRALAHEGSV